MEISKTTAKQYDAMVEWVFNQGLAFEDADEVVEAVREKWSNPSTQKTKLALLKGYLNRKEGFDKKALERYGVLLDDAVKKSKKVDPQEETEKEKENWLEWEAVLAFGEKLKRDALASWGNEKTYVGKLEDAILVALYTDVTVVRNDYANLYFSEAKPNWLDVRTGVITVREHKTAKTVGAITRQLPPTILFMIQTLLMKSPREMLFAQNESALSARLIRLFETHTGKKVGSTMLRHIFITFQQRGEKTLKEKDALATEMGHSKDTQTAYRRPGCEGC
jgi:integrase